MKNFSVRALLITGIMGMASGAYATEHRKMDSVRSQPTAETSSDSVSCCSQDHHHKMAMASCQTQQIDHKIKPIKLPARSERV